MKPNQNFTVKVWLEGLHSLNNLQSITTINVSDTQLPDWIGKSQAAYYCTLNSLSYCFDRKYDIIDPTMKHTTSLMYTPHWIKKILAALIYPLVIYLYVTTSLKYSLWMKPV